MANGGYDVSFVANADESALIAHCPDCPVVQRHRREGLPVFNMMGCAKPLPAEIERHECLRAPAS